MADTSNIIVRFSDEALEQLERCDTDDDRRKLYLKFFQDEVDRMNAWARRELGAGGAKFEDAWLRTYLFMRLAQNSVQELPRTELADHPAAS